MTKLRAFLAIMSLLLIAAPAAAEDTVQLNQACNKPGTVVTSTAPFSGEVETPVGALNLTTAEAGSYVVDLAGTPVGTRKNVTLTLSFDNPVADYDMVVNGVNEFGTDSPEVFTVSNATHCSIISVQTEVFIGAPIDVLTLDVKVAK